MFINVPKLNKKDIKKCGIIYKGKDYSFIISDLNNRSLKNCIKISDKSYYNYVYNVLNSYLFIISGTNGIKDVNPNKIDFISKILKFEYIKESKPVLIQEFNVPSNIFYTINKDRWLQDDLMGVTGKMIDDIIKVRKPHLQAYKRPYERHLRYLCDNNRIGTFQNGLCCDILTGNKIYIYKDTDCHIIKTGDYKF